MMKSMITIGCRRHFQLETIVTLFLVLLTYPTGHRRNCVSAFSEKERRIEREKRGWKWPPTKFVPNTDGWKKLMKRRFKQIEQINDSKQRYYGYVEAVTSAYTLQNFTENGWGLTRAPTNLLKKLQKVVHDGLKDPSKNSKVIYEGPRSVVNDTINPSLFINMGDELSDLVLNELKPINEAWSNISLQPHYAYGFRLYRNQSKCLMHLDRTDTHIISSIFHIDSSKDSQPWPIVIEDYQGNTNEVILKPGDILLYESAKCLHGRPKSFNGSWYTSIFVHYHPKSKEWNNIQHDLESHYGVPNHWEDDPPSSSSSSSKEQEEHHEIVDKLQLKEDSGGMYEPECEPDQWCALSNNNEELSLKKWSGPGEENYVISTNGKVPLQLIHHNHDSDSSTSTSHQEGKDDEL